MSHPHRQALPTDRVLNLPHYIKCHLDGTLSFPPLVRALRVCGPDATRSTA